MGNSRHRRDYPAHHCLWKFLAVEQAHGSLTLSASAIMGRQEGGILAQPAAEDCS
jgi:hypothetical protein